MNYAAIKYNDIANGPGVRTSVFVSGCRHHCKGCFNEIAWDFDYGMPFYDSVIEEVLESLQKARIRLGANVNFELTMELLFMTIKEKG